MKKELVVFSLLLSLFSNNFLCAQEQDSAQKLNVAAAEVAAKAKAALELAQENLAKVEAAFNLLVE